MVYNEKQIVYAEVDYKYQLAQAFEIDLPLLPDARADIPNAILWPNGHILINKGFCWDGPSGPTLDTPAFMRGALVHDALYRMMRLGALPETWRPQADNILRDLCTTDGMSKLRSWYVHWAVKRFASTAARRSKRVLFYAPRSLRVPTRIE